MSRPADAAEVADLRRRLEEAEETLRAIRSGEVDGLVVGGPAGDRVFTLHGADHSYRVLIEAMAQGAVSLSTDGTVLFCNRAFAELVRVPHERAAGAAAADFVPPADRDALRALLARGRDGPAQLEGRVRTAAGADVPVLLAVAPLPLPDAAALCLVVTDLTEQQRHKDLQEADRRKTEFLATLAHELRNPLAPIRSGLQILDTPGVDGEAAARVRGILGRQVGHMVRLIDDLLDVSRISRGKMDLRRERVPLAEVVAGAVETSRPLIDDLGHTLAVELPPEPVELDADPVRLTQVFANLLNNAAKYSPRGGRIWLTAARAGGEVTVAVRDGGIGIAADQLARVFEMFGQVGAARSWSQGGLGIGLALARGLVEMHGGTITARSDGPGTGSTFIVRLPCREALGTTDGKPPGDGRQSSIVNRQSSIRKRVLVVDDNVDGAESLAMVLGLMGSEVRTAGDGLAGVAAAEAFRPHLILMDIGMPVLNGYDACRRIRAEAWGRDVVLVAQTGWGQEDDRRKSREAGFDHHLVKPVEPAALLRLLTGTGPADRSGSAS